MSWTSRRISVGGVNISIVHWEFIERTNLIEHLVALVENENLDVAKPQLLVAYQSVETAWGCDNYVRVGLLVGQDFDVLLHGSSSVEDRGLDVWKVLAKSGVLVLDLVGQFTSVAHDKN
jgi:hypothetical protein